MIRKIICLGLILVMCFTLFSGCNQDSDINTVLSQRNTEQKTTLDEQGEEAPTDNMVDTAVNEAVAVDEESPNGDRGEWIRVDDGEDFATSDTYWSNINLSTLAYKEARAYFIEDDKYTDDFGGVFVDNNGIINICVVGDREPIKSNYLIYRQVNNSYNYLRSIVDEISEHMIDFTIWLVSVKDSHNRVMIHLKNENVMPFLIEKLKAKDLYQKDTLEVVIWEKGCVLNSL